MTPLTYLTGYGAKAYPVTALTWGLLIISIVVVVIVTGLVLSFSRRSRGTPGTDAKAARRALLDELAELEVARLAGDVGPKTYERVRRELVDALARTLAPA